jgi:hypothetical protein
MYSKAVRLAIGLGTNPTQSTDTIAASHRHEHGNELAQEESA